jgi:hypothetical protein
MDLPDTTYISRQDVLRVVGITRDDLEKVVDAGLITPVLLPGAKYRKYITAEIQRVLGVDQTKKGGAYGKKVKKMVRKKK